MIGFWKMIDDIQSEHTVKLNAFDVVLLLSQAWNENIVERTFNKKKYKMFLSCGIGILRYKVRSDIQ